MSDRRAVGGLIIIIISSSTTTTTTTIIIPFPLQIRRPSRGASAAFAEEAPGLAPAVVLAPGDHHVHQGPGNAANDK
jgi:hypothetical protein